MTVTLTRGARTVTAPNAITVSPAVYNEPVLTPPAISGNFTVPAKTNGKQTVTVTYLASFWGSTSATRPRRR